MEFIDDGLLAGAAIRPGSQPAPMFCDGDPHYPSESEQRRIEHLLGREFEPVASVAGGDTSAAAGDALTVHTSVVDRGRSLTDAERQALAARLMDPFYAALAGFQAGDSARTVRDQADAFDITSRAWTAITKLFGAYIDRRITLTNDETATAAQRIKEGRVVVSYGVGGSAAAALARTIIDTHCTQCRRALSGLDDASKHTVINAMVATALNDGERGPQLQRAAQARVGGSYTHADRRIRIGQYTPDPFGTAVHELIHALTHPAFRAAFMDERNIIEGFTEYFARQVVSGRSGSYDDVVARMGSVRSAMSGPFLFSFEGSSAEESLRLAYFRGRLDLIGWRPSGPAEARAVATAGGAAEWDLSIARTQEAAYILRAQAAQDPHPNVLGAGIYFSRGTGDGSTIAVRYARVLARTTPYARGQLLIEGQVLGSPIDDPRRLGGSIGIVGEYQEPYFYAGGGVRLVGSAALSGGTGGSRVDMSPFVGVGIRAWQRIRVGAEGFVLLPLTAQNIQLGVGATVGVEF
jgi:hypothetical protein